MDKSFSFMNAVALSIAGLWQPMAAVDESCMPPSMAKIVGRRITSMSGAWGQEALLHQLLAREPG